MADAAGFSAFSGPDGRPTESERRLIEASATGEFARCSDLEGDERTVSAALIAVLATGEFRPADGGEWRPHPNGLRLLGARVPKRLILTNCRTFGPVMLNRCTFEQGINLDNTRIAGSLFLRKSRLQGECRLMSAVIDGQFAADEAIFENKGGDAIRAQGARTADSWFMNNVTVRGRVDIARAEVGGQFGANAATFDNKGEVAIWAQGIKVANGWFMREAAVKGQLDLNSAEVGYQFSANEATFENERGVAIRAQAVKVTDGWFMRKTIVKGQLDLNSAEVGYQFSANEATFENEKGIAIRAQAVKVADGWFMRNANVRGRVHINRAEIGGPFLTAGSVFVDTAGRAILAVSARVLGGVVLGRGTRVEGDLDLRSATIERGLDLSEVSLKAGRHRALRLQEATVIGDTVFREASILGHIHASRARFEGRLSFQGAVITAATLARFREALSEEPGVASDTADAERQERYRDHAIVLNEARIAGRLVMPDECPGGIVDLSRARCDTLEDVTGGWAPALKRKADTCAERVSVDGRDIQHLMLDGFEYGHLANPGGVPGEVGTPDGIAKARCRWLAGQSAAQLKRHFNPQPWRQAAAALRAMGHDEAAQAVAIERRVRERQADDVGWFARLVSWFLQVVAGYGFKPWWTVAWSAAVVVVWAGIYFSGSRLCADPAACGGRPLYIETRYHGLDPAVAAAGEYPSFEAIRYSLDVFVPLLDLSAEAYWSINTNVWLTLRSPPVDASIPLGWILYGLFVLERIAGALLIAIAVTGFTGLLTRDDR